MTCTCFLSCDPSAAASRGCLLFTSCPDCRRTRPQITGQGLGRVRDMLAACSRPCPVTWGLALLQSGQLVTSRQPLDAAAEGSHDRKQVQDVQVHVRDMLPPRPRPVTWDLALLHSEHLMNSRHAEGIAVVIAHLSSGALSAALVKVGL